jgi:hypothetical protein
MPKILAILAVLTTAAFFSLPSPASAAQSKGGAETDQSATVATDISAHRRRYRHRHYPYYYGGYGGPYVGVGPFYAGWGGPYYRPYPYRYGYWGGPNIFPFGPWW